MKNATENPWEIVLQETNYVLATRINTDYEAYFIIDEVFYNGEFSFDVKLTFGHLDVIVDDTKHISTYSELWENHSIKLPVGKHIIKFEYYTDGFVSVQNNGIFIDNVNFQ